MSLKEYFLDDEVRKKHSMARKGKPAPNKLHKINFLLSKIMIIFVITKTN